MVYTDELIANEFDGRPILESDHEEEYYFYLHMNQFCSRDRLREMILHILKNEDERDYFIDIIIDALNENGELDLVNIHEIREVL